MDRLPKDALVAILSRLAPRSLAAARCVCKEWRATIDARCELRADLLPISLGGIFVNVERVRLGMSPEHTGTAFFARPSMARKIAGKLESYAETGHPDRFPYIKSTCNGLLLLFGGRVVNPATRQWASLPPFLPTPDGLEGVCYDHDMYIVYDPTVSPHYEVLLLPYVPLTFQFGALLESTAWPPSPCIIPVFSSKTGRWEQRSFIREGEPVGNLPDVKFSIGRSNCHSVFWRETVYVHCRGDFLVRLKLSGDNYQVIKLPAGVETDQLYLGKSKNGVYLASVKIYQCRLQIWFLNEFDHKTEWVLKNNMNLFPLFQHIFFNNKVVSYQYSRTTGHWILQDGNYDEENKGPIVETNCDWNSDDDDALNIEDYPEGDAGYICPLLGFHPYKEIIFLQLGGKVFAYHFSSSKYQDLGMLRMNGMIREAFMYTPCWIGELS